MEYSGQCRRSAAGRLVEDGACGGAIGALRAAASDEVDQSNRFFFFYLLRVERTGCW